MYEEIEAFRNWVAGLKRAHRGTPYPADVRREALRLAAALRADGLGRYAVGRALGIRAETLSSWSEEETRPGLIPVVVDPEPARARASARPSRTEIVVTSPSGWRIEGVGLADLDRLLRALA